MVSDVRALEGLPSVDLVTAGFPCQDLSQAGRTLGIGGRQSGLVDHVFRLLRDGRPGPRWVLFENVPFMLRLDRGRAMRVLTRSLEQLGFSWAYRVVDARSFGLPQRRQRVVLLASRTGGSSPRTTKGRSPCRHRATPSASTGPRGLGGLGWAPEGVPTLKGGSSVGIPSPPAIWLCRTDGIVVPDIRDAERLQGFPADWTAAATGGRKRVGHRWKLVGNAVSVPMAAWLGARLRRPGVYDADADVALAESARWPRAAWGTGGEVRTAAVSMWPVAMPYRPLTTFLRYPTTPLSFRATRGFLARTREASLRFEPAFIAAVERHLERMAERGRAASGLRLR